MTITRFSFGILLAASLCWTGCEMFSSHTNPIAGWHWSSLVNLHNNKAITDDYQDYIRTLPPEDRRSVGPIDFYEDGTGQHAVEIEEALNGTWWYHVLIYDKADKRIETVKYSPGHYRS